MRAYPRDTPLFYGQTHVLNIKCTTSPLKLDRKNTLAYFTRAAVMNKIGFITLTLCVNAIKLFFWYQVQLKKLECLSMTSFSKLVLYLRVSWSLPVLLPISGLPHNRDKNLSVTNTIAYFATGCKWRRKVIWWHLNQNFQILEFDQVQMLQNVFQCRPSLS